MMLSAILTSKGTSSTCGVDRQCMMWHFRDLLLPVRAEVSPLDMNSVSQAARRRE